MHNTYARKLSFLKHLKIRERNQCQYCVVANIYHNLTELRVSTMWHATSKLFSENCDTVQVREFKAKKLLGLGNHIVIDYNKATSYRVVLIATQCLTKSQSHK